MFTSQFGCGDHTTFIDCIDRIMTSEPRRIKWVCPLNAHCHARYLHPPDCRRTADL